MDRSTTNLLIVVLVAVSIIYLARPKGNMLDEVINPLKKPLGKFDPPKKMPLEASELLENAKTAISAMRSAISSGEKSKELKELNSIILKKQKIKLFTDKQGKLMASDIKGNVILRE